MAATVIPIRIIYADREVPGIGCQHSTGLVRLTGTQYAALGHSKKSSGGDPRSHPSDHPVAGPVLYLQLGEEHRKPAERPGRIPVPPAVCRCLVWPVYGRSEERRV